MLYIKLKDVKTFMSLLRLYFFILLLLT